MRNRDRARAVEDTRIMLTHIGKGNYKTAYRYARSLQRRFRPYAELSFLSTFTRLAPGEMRLIATGESIATVRVYASKAGKLLQRKFSIMQSKSNPGRYICKRIK